MRNTYHHISEEPPVTLFQIGTGDEQAFRRLFQYYSPRLNQFAYSIIKLKEVATEIVDDVFIKLWKQREKAASISNIRVYLYVAVKNSSLNYLSSKAHRQITEPFNHFDIALSRDQAPDEKMISAELLGKITAAVEALPPRCKVFLPSIQPLRRIVSMPT